MKQYKYLFGAIIVFFFASYAFGQADASVTEVYPLMIQLRADRGSLERFYFLFKNSPERRERFKTLYTDYLNKLEQLPFEKWVWAAVPIIC